MASPSQHRASPSRVTIRRRRLTALSAMLVVFLAVVGVAQAALGGFNPFGGGEVGQTTNGAILLPTNQWISPAGTRVEYPKGRLQGSAISPDGRYLAALTWHEFRGYLTIFDLRTGQVIQEEGQSGTASLGSKLGETSKDETREQVAADGPYYSPDGKTLWVPQTGDIAKFAVNSATGTVTREEPIILPKAAVTKAPETSKEPAKPGEALASGIAFSSDGSEAYVALNGSNSLAVYDTQTNQLEAEIPVGEAPRQVVVDGDTAYVSNEGGRPPRPGDTTNYTDGTPVVSDPVTGGASTGTVSVVDLSTNQEEGEIPVGLQPTALYRDGSALFVANSNDDSLSVIDTATDRVVQTVSTNPLPGAKVGSYANAITMPDPDHVLVSIGRDNAIAQYSFAGLTKKVRGHGWGYGHGRHHHHPVWHEKPVRNPLRFEGLVPTDWYPVQVQSDPALGRGTVVVTNARGIGARGPQSKVCKGPETSPATECATGFNTYDETGTLTVFKMPSRGRLGQYTKTVFADNDWKNVPAINSGAGDTVPNVIPTRLGGRSPIKHVFVIVKENRTYDQVLGDLGEGNGDPSLAQFGAKITPNLHSIAKRFGVLDNFYDEGTLSADGHNWIVQAEANDYIEKEFGAFYRSYPAEGNDALAYQRDGFLWNAAEAADQSVKVFGEYNYFITGDGDGGKWKEWYEDSQILEGKQSGPLPIPIDKYQTSSDIPSLNEVTDHDYPRFDLEIPDQYRYDIWKAEFEREQQSNSVPGLTLIWLPDDHTGGAPKPVAQAADNDLAFGKIVEAISHSPVWKESAIFGVEDDTQNGVDHVDGHRGPAVVISPYSKGGVDHEYATQPNMVKTIERILAIRPMNQVDYAAEPMYGAFTEHPNFAPYTALPNQIPLTLGVPGFPQPAGANYVPQSMRGIAGAWDRWKSRQRFQGPDGRPDSARPVQFDRYDWYASHDWRRAYPGDPRIYRPAEVPGRGIPAAVAGS